MSDNTTRLEQLRAKLAASLKSKDGPALPGYGERVAAIRAEIARLEAENG